MDSGYSDRPKLFLEAVLVGAVFILPSLAPPPGFAANGTVLSASNLIRNLAAFIPQSLLLIYIIGLRGEGREFHLRPPRRSDLLAALILAPVLAGSAYGGAALASLLTGAPALPAAAAQTDLPFFLLLPLLAASALAVGYREELLYRVYLIRRLETAGTPSWAAAVLSTALFAAGHGYQGLPGILAAAASGAILAAVYLRLRSLHALAWAHAAYDFVVLLSMAVQGPT